MKTLLLKNAAAILPGEKAANASVLIEDGQIARITSDDIKADEALDLAGKTLYPGFIDIHIHGAAGVDVMSAGPGELERMARFLLQNGVTRWMPTFVPAAEDKYRAAIKTLNEFIQWQAGKPAARIAGVHYEGPFVSEKQCGALHEQYFRTFEKEEDLSSLPRLASDNVRHMTTLAPEVSGGIELIKKLRELGWIVSIGHTRAEVETLNSAFAAGARHMTHFFNAMTGLHHRDLGAVGWGLANDDVTCDVIADGVHVHPDILKMLYKAKTPGSLSLISDAILPAGMGDGEYDVWDEKIKVQNGRTANERGSIAGSVITMINAVKMMTSLGIPEWEVAQMASLNPARLLGIDRDHGSIEVGKRADLVALDNEGRAALTILNGEIAWQAG